MSDTAQKLFDGIKAAKEIIQAAAPGLKDLGSDISSEISRQATLGSTEIAAALFHGNGFVLYGPNRETAAQHSSEQEREQERGGMER